MHLFIAPSLLESSNLGNYIKGLTFEGNLKPRIISLLRYLQTLLGIEKLALLGFSWYITTYLLVLI